MLALVHLRRHRTAENARVQSRLIVREVNKFDRRDCTRSASLVCERFGLQSFTVGVDLREFIPCIFRYRTEKCSGRLFVLNFDFVASLQLRGFAASVGLCPTPHKPFEKGLTENFFRFAVLDYGFARTPAPHENKFLTLSRTISFPETSVLPCFALSPLIFASSISAASFAIRYPSTSIVVRCGLHIVEYM